jgi:hypothetical protein
LPPRLAANAGLGRPGVGPAGTRAYSCRGWGLAIDVIIPPLSLAVRVPWWGVGGWLGGWADLRGFAPSRCCELPNSAEPAPPR